MLGTLQKIGLQISKHVEHGATLGKAKRKKSIVDEAVDSADWTDVDDAVADDLTRQFEDAARVEWDASGANISFDIFSKDARDYAEERGAELVTDISDSTRDMLRSSLAQAIEDGQTNAEFAKTLMDSYAFSEERAATIARTELAFADVAGHTKASREAGAVGKRWLLSDDHNFDDECNENADEDVIPFDDAWASGDMWPPSHPNCQCDFEAVYADDPDAEDLLDDMSDDESDEEAEASKVAKAQVDAPAHEAATSSLNLRNQPSTAQISAGNYRMGHINVSGLDITIENPAQSVRRGVAPDGTSWVSQLTHHYGYIRRTEGADGDHVDCLVCVGMDDGYGGPVWVVDQYIDGKFDEHKCLVGWPDEIRARSAYLEQYQPGWKGLGNITRMTMEQFKEWLRNGDTTRPAKPQMGNEST